ncbi:hemerythrin HHE cation binding domain-containing protein [Pseudonocardia sediminis]|uniref:Hemerythrin HHE cation binding domain-containing protein n=1 Tax=Pseudonocardia sediminis TaxID=1397368 RepID=A0A4Q7V2G9_PSEST|nr:hemerythrin domain-containing protein [Pseudonocardia sediminis]RZT87688.1 hemerythrin HHE cation binding domain-containing protein [Pseudonocardia sediminis]
MTTARSADVPDLLGMSLAHRMMRTDLRRLTDAAQAIADGDTCGDRRAAALTRWVGTLCDEIHHHHTVEDEIAWPVIARHAGHAVDLSVLTDDHAALDPLLDRVRSAAAAFAQAPVEVRAVPAGELAARLGRVRDEIDEHLDAEEAGLFPVIERYVPRAEWDEVEKRVRNGGPGLRFVLPRIAAVVTDEEWAVIRAEAGIGLVVLAAVLRPGHRRRERIVFG